MRRPTSTRHAVRLPSVQRRLFSPTEWHSPCLHAYRAVRCTDRTRQPVRRFRLRVGRGWDIVQRDLRLHARRRRVKLVLSGNQHRCRRITGRTSSVLLTDRRMRHPRRSRRTIRRLSLRVRRGRRPMHRQLRRRLHGSERIDVRLPEREHGRDSAAVGDAADMHCGCWMCGTVLSGRWIRREWMLERECGRHVRGPVQRWVHPQALLPSGYRILVSGRQH